MKDYKILDKNLIGTDKRTLLHKGTPIFRGTLSDCYAFIQFHKEGIIEEEQVYSKQ